MTEHSTLQPGDKVVALSSLSRSVGVVSALAAAISYQVVYGVPDLLTILILFVPALIIGIIAGWLVSLRYIRGGKDGTTTIVKHGRDGVPATIRTALVVAVLIIVIFFLLATLCLRFEGNSIGLLATFAVPAILVSSVWALLASLA